MVLHVQLRNSIRVLPYVGEIGATKRGREKVPYTKLVLPLAVL